MNLYVESSAVLAWLLSEDREFEVNESLVGAEAIVASDLTMIECDRVLNRIVVLSEAPEADVVDRRAKLNTAANGWHLVRIGPEVVSRARQPFPEEPIRSLDAIHLASALVARSAFSDLVILSLDDRIRRAASALGFDLSPGKEPQSS